MAGSMEDAGLNAAKALYRWSAPQAQAARLTPMTGRVWPPKCGARSRPLADACFLGEDVAVAYLRQYGEAVDAKRIGGVLPIDALSSWHAVEVKIGLVTNGPGAQQWRLTFSEARGEERELLKTLSKDARAVYFRTKQRRIVRRKYELVEALRSLTKREIRPVTITSIVDPATLDVDVFWFDGFHQRIGWNTPATRAAYRGSFHVAWDGRR